MTNYLILAQIIVATSVAYVWIFRYDNIIKEFNQFGLNEVTRTAVGAVKIALSTLLIVGIWYPALIFIPSILMGFLMLAAQYFHFKIKNPFAKHFPSLFLLILCIYMILATWQVT
jgi:hypothetical protein